MVNYGLLIMEAELAWNDFCEEKGIRNPKDESFHEGCFYGRSYGCKYLYVDGTAYKNVGPEEQKKYEDLKHKFIGCYIFFVGGYEALLDMGYEDMKDLFKPCESSDRQCSLGCPLFGKDCRDVNHNVPDELVDIFDFIKRDWGQNNVYYFKSFLLNHYRDWSIFLFLR